MGVSVSPLEIVKSAASRNFEVVSKCPLWVETRRHTAGDDSAASFVSPRLTKLSWDASRLLLITPNRTKCQERKDESTSLDQQLRDDLAREKARVQAELDRLDHQSCLSCLVTGVGTCLGLAGYFGYLGMEEMHIQPVTAQVRQRAAFFGVMSVGWIGIGAYRLYLG